jgi:hypothetical protein
MKIRAKTTANDSKSGGKQRRGPILPDLSLNDDPFPRRLMRISWVMIAKSILPQRVGHVRPIVSWESRSAIDNLSITFKNHVVAGQ